MTSKILALIDVARFSSRALISMIFKPSRLAKRSWVTEYVFRLSQVLLSESTTKSIEWLRQREAILKMRSLAMTKVRYEKVEISGVSCEWCRPKAQNTKRTIIYFHGGGYVIGSTNGFQNTSALLSLNTNANVLSVDYRLGPEHILPAAQDDAISVTEYCLGQASFGEVILVGDSAGGGLCIATCLALDKLKPEKKLAACILISPWIDPANTSGSMVENEPQDILSRKLLSKWISAYVDEADLSDPRINFSEQDFSAFPPVYIQAASAEIFIDQVKQFELNLRKQNISVEMDIFEDLFHDFQIFNPLVPDATKAIKMIGNYLDKHCNR